jgi:hypothetical protein
MFPFDYAKVSLYDELKFRAYRQQLLSISDPKDVLKAYNISQSMQKAYDEAEIKRRTLFTESSVYNHFGVIAQIRNTNFFGRLLAALLKPATNF